MKLSEYDYPRTYPLPESVVSHHLHPWIRGAASPASLTLELTWS